MADGQADFQADRAGTAWRLAAALALSVLAAWFVLAGGVLGVLIGLPVLAAAGFFALTLAQDALQRGPLVSVGPRGIFDRRISRDWIGWEWFGDIQLCRWPRALAVTLYLHPGSETALPLRRRARLLSWVNWVVRPGVRWLFPQRLESDLTTLTAAIDRFSGGRFDLAKQLTARS